MKICLISNLFPPYSQAGAGVYVAHLAQALAKDHQVVVVTSEPGAHLKPRREVQSDGTVVYRMAPFNLGELTDFPRNMIAQAAFRAIDFYHPQVATTVRDILARERPDIVHIHKWVGLSLAALLSSVKSGRFDRVPVAMTLHDDALCCAYSGPGHPDGRGCNPALACHALGQVNRALTDSVGLVLSPSQFLLDLHRRRAFFPRAECSVLPYGLPAAIETAGADRSASKPTFDLLFLGPIRFDRGTDLLVRAFRALPEPSLRLHIAGAGPMTTECRRLSAGDSRIIFHGFVSGGARQALFDSADCLVLPSRRAVSYPLSIEEAFQSGPVVIASRTGGIPEMVRDGVNGLLLEPGHEAAIGAAIERLRRSPELREQLRVEARRTARLYDMAFHASHLAQAYQRLISANRSSPFSRKAA